MQFLDISLVTVGICYFGFWHVFSFFPWKVAFSCLLAQQTHLLEHIHCPLKYLNSPSKLEHQVSKKHLAQVTLHPSSGLPKKNSSSMELLDELHIISSNLEVFNKLAIKNRNKHREITIFIVVMKQHLHHNHSTIFKLYLLQPISIHRCKL